jgi:hypothetical protein
LRDPLKHSSIRTHFVCLAVIFASCLAAASDNGSSPRAVADLGGPSNFDYMVLASFADSPRLFSMAGYRSSAVQRPLPRPELSSYPVEN